MRRRTSRTGFTLIEILVVMAVMTVALGLGTTLLLAAMRTDQVGTATLHRLSWRAQLADQFRADVAGAAAAPDRLGDRTAGPACLILRTPAGTHVVYQWQGAKLIRIVGTGDTETRTPVVPDVPELSGEFIRTDGDRPLVTLKLVETPALGTARRAEVAAAVGGDLR